MCQSVLNGAWEEPGVIGIRIEIDEPNITVLWRNAPVLMTKFQRHETKEGIELILHQTGLRYEQATSDYATLTKLFYHDGKLEMVEEFPITGTSSCTLQKTENSRYGNYLIVDEQLEQLEGEWESEDKIYQLQFHKDVVILEGRTCPIHMLQAKGQRGGRYRIVDQDSSHYELPSFYSLEYENGVIYAQEKILDAKPVVIVFHKK